MISWISCTETEQKRVIGRLVTSAFNSLARAEWWMNATNKERGRRLALTNLRRALVLYAAACKLDGHRHTWPEFEKRAAALEAT